MKGTLAIMGSGETTPTMTGVHRELLARAQGATALLDTPYGFQENADDITARALEYFDRSVRTRVGVATMRSADESPLVLATAVSRIREARWVFTGPGSPSYALRQWKVVGMAGLLADKLNDGSVVVMSSAAALTVGCVSVPVYEIYKCGEAPTWLEGLNLISAHGIEAAVIPHFDNAEGGNHDTRFCYLGERRLRIMEEQLPADVWVLGVDEHTACMLDLDSDTFTVAGRGGVTVRRAGQQVARYEMGTSLPIDVLRDAGAGHSSPTKVQPQSTESATPAAMVVPTQTVLDTATAIESRGRCSIDSGDVTGAVTAILELDEALEEWASDTSTTDERARARAIARSLIVRLGEVAVDGARDPREVLGPVIEVALQARRAAREHKDWALSDAIRDGLDGAGVEVRDTAAGMEWVLKGT